MNRTAQVDEAVMPLTSPRTSTDADDDLKHEGAKVLLEPSSIQNVLDLVFGRWRSQTVYAGVSSGVLEVLVGQALDASAIAERLGLVTVRTQRLLRALATLGLVRDTGTGAFELTSEGRLLTSSGTPSLQAMLLLEEGPEHYAAWRHLPALLREDSASGFEREYGMDAWQYLNVTPRYKNVFQDAMSAYSAAEADAIVASLTKSDMPNHGTLCDVGGGDGGLLQTLAQTFPGLSPLLFDLPTVIESAEGRQGMETGFAMERVAGDMFHAVPPADIYLLKHVIHDWSDEECAVILRNISQSAQPGARLLVCEFVIPDEPVPSFASLFDIHMMCVTTGRQRTFNELAALLNETGWSTDALRPTLGSPISIVFASRLS